VPEGGEDAADDVGKPHREQPARASQLHRLAADALEVDLIAGEEEEHPQAEVGEEVDEAVGAGDVENLRADEDSEEELDHDHRGREPAGDNGDGDCRQRRDQDDDEKGLGVDLDHLGAPIPVPASRRP
jgi:hypothetical protein